MTSWITVAPTTGQIDELLRLYACTLTVSGSLFVVTHTSGRSERVASLDEVIDVAIKLARQG